MVLGTLVDGDGTGRPLRTTDRDHDQERLRRRSTRRSRRPTPDTQQRQPDAEHLIDPGHRQDRLQPRELEPGELERGGRRAARQLVAGELEPRELEPRELVAPRPRDLRRPRARELVAGELVRRGPRVRPGSLHRDGPDPGELVAGELEPRKLVVQLHQVELEPVTEGPGRRMSGARIRGALAIYVRSRDGDPGTPPRQTLPALMPLLRGYCDFYGANPPNEELEQMVQALVADARRGGLPARRHGRGCRRRCVGFAACGWKWSSLRGARIVVLEDLFVACEPAARSRLRRGSRDRWPSRRGARDRLDRQRPDGSARRSLAARRAARSRGHSARRIEATPRRRAGLAAERDGQFSWVRHGLQAGVSTQRGTSVPRMVAAQSRHRARRRLRDRAAATSTPA